MSRRSNIIQFPGTVRANPQQSAEIRAEQMRRAAALPQWAKDLDVEWLYRDLAERKIDRRF